MTQHAPHRSAGQLVAVGLISIVGAGSLWPSQAGAVAPVRSTADAADIWYRACIEGAPTTPDSYQQWALHCHRRVAAGQM